MEKLTIGVRVMEKMIHYRKSTIHMTVVASRISRKKMKKGRRNLMMTPTTKIRTTTSPYGIM